MYKAVLNANQYSSLGEGGGCTHSAVGSTYWIAHWGFVLMQGLAFGFILLRVESLTEEGKI